MDLILLQWVVPLSIFVTLLALGFFCGGYLERRHYASILARETAPGQVLVFPSRKLPPDTPAPASCLVSGSVVVSADYFKRFAASLRMLVGGRLNTYESLLDRARREALLRMRAQASLMGATHIFNVKIETMAIGGRAAGGVAALEVLAYGTALIPRVISRVDGA